MEKTRKLLSDRYLNVFVYYRETFKLLKRFLKEDRKYFLYLFGIYFIEFMGNIYKMPAGLENVKWLKMGKEIVLLLILQGMTTFLYRKAIYKIEGEKNLETGKVIYRIILISIISTVLIKFVLNDNIINDTFFYEHPNISAVILVWCFMSLFYLLYFTPMYVSRNISFSEALSYSFHLNRGNRIRLYVPLFSSMLILNMVSKGITEILKYSVAIIGENLFMLLLVAGIITFMQMIKSVVIVIMLSVVYLNVEYMDRKKIADDNDTADEMQESENNAEMTGK